MREIYSPEELEKVWDSLSEDEHRFYQNHYKKMFKDDAVTAVTDNLMTATTKAFPDLPRESVIFVSLLMNEFIPFFVPPEKRKSATEVSSLARTKMFKELIDFDSISESFEKSLQEFPEDIP